MRALTTWISPIRHENRYIANNSLMKEMSCFKWLLIFCFMSEGFALNQSADTLIAQGEPFTLNCTQKKTNYVYMYWYKMTTSGRLETVVFSTDGQAPGVEKEFQGHLDSERIDGQSLSLRTTAAEPGDSAAYYCAKQERGIQPANFGQGTRLIVLEKDVPNREPNVVLFDPSPLEISQKKKATLVCLATNFYPGYVTLTWSVNGKNRTEGVKTDDEAKQDGGSRMYSLSSRLRLSMQEWFNARNSFQCTVHMYHPDEKDVQRTIMGQEGCGLSEESYRRHATSAKFTYILFLCKAALYGFIVTVLVWRFKGSDKQFT